MDTSTQGRDNTCAGPKWAVQMHEIHKRFGAVHANQAVQLNVPKATIHGLVGENGAGKSTLMSILYGFYSADSGRISINGKDVTIHSPGDAIAAGVGMVHQHFMLVDTLSALDNVMLGAESHLYLPKAQAQMRAQLEDLMARTGLRVNLDTLVADLPVGEQQRLEILKALVRGANILILDEPTAVLTPQETVQMFQVLRTLRSQGTTIIIITHKLKEVMALCDNVTVMRQGQVVANMATEQASVETLAEAMVGRKVAMGRQTAMDSSAKGAVVLQAEALLWRDDLNTPRLHHVDLTLHAGEIVGVAGVSGNGQSELLDVLSGLKVPHAGKIHLLGQDFSPAHWLNPKLARNLGLAHVPEDRYARALVMSFAAWESGVLGYEDLSEFSTGGFMRHGKMHERTREMMERFDVRPRNDLLRSGHFSGGNQQKLVLAREMGQSPKILLVGQPTRGVDIGAIEFIHGQLRAMRNAGCAVLVVSSELDEILALSDRVVVMNQGQVSGILPIEECDELKIGLLMTGGHT